MRWVIGIDEAGYGPKLGPLVVSASIWELDDRLPVDEVIDRLAPEFLPKPWSPNAQHIPLGDSKQIYRPGLGLEGLQAAVHFLISQNGFTPANISSLLSHLAENDSDRIQHWPWYAANGQEESRASIGAPSSEVSSLATEKLHRLGIRFRGFRVRILDECEFNAQVRHLGNKSHVVGALAGNLLRECYLRIRANPESEFGDSQDIWAYCDRQGGRKRYAPLLLSAMEGLTEWVDVLNEQPDMSDYRVRLPQQSLRVQFRVGSDAFLPAAAASLAAKYLRELLMERLNQYWRKECPGIAPTAGYPVDAERFRKAMETVASRKGFSIDQWWRSC